MGRISGYEDAAMSVDLYIFDGDVPDDENLIAEWLEDDSRWEAPLAPRLAAFVSDLERKYPRIDQDPDNSPWASWPIAQAMVDGRCCGFNIVWSAAEQMSAAPAGALAGVACSASPTLNNRPPSTSSNPPRNTHTPPSSGGSI